MIYTTAEMNYTNSSFPWRYIIQINCLCSASSFIKPNEIIHIQACSTPLSSSTQTAVFSCNFVTHNTFIPKCPCTSCRLYHHHHNNSNNITLCTIFFIFKACLTSIMQWKRDRLKRYGGLYCSRKRMLNTTVITVSRSLRWYTGWSVHPKWSFWTENDQVEMISPFNVNGTES